MLSRHCQLMFRSHVIRDYVTRTMAISSSISEILNDRSLLEKEVEVSGWIKSARRQKEVFFIDLSDGLRAGERIQVLVDRQAIPSDVQDKLQHHASVTLSGVLKKSNHPAQEVEIEAKQLKVWNTIMDPEVYPFAPRKLYPGKHVRKYPYFSAKLNDHAAMLRVRNRLSQAIHSFFQDSGFVQIHTPIITTNDCEGAGDVFEVVAPKERIQELKALEEEDHDKEDEDQSVFDHYFKKKVFLTVSGQLHLEAICNGISKVYNFSPVFRAEGGASPRHLSEFSMIEGEVAFVQNLDHLLPLVTSLLRTTVGQVLDKNGDDIALFSKLRKESNTSNVAKLVSNDFVVMTYDEAIQALEKKSNLFSHPPEYGKRLSKENELYLAEKYCNGLPVYIVDWPKTIKPFYSRLSDSATDKVEAFDLILPVVGEVVGGSLREYRYETLSQRVQEQQIDPDSIEWYLAMRKAGAAPTGGFGLGFERLVQFILGASSIRDTVPFARSPRFCQL